MSLIDKIVKHKRLQRLSGSLTMIIPEAWIRNMNWTKTTPFAMEFKPFTKQIIITEEFKEIQPINTSEGIAQRDEIREGLEDGEEISKPILV